jgi:hypothetical protein
MAGLPRNRYDLLPYSTNLSIPPASSSDNLNYTSHRSSKREYIESSDAEDVPSSPPRKYRSRKRREWRDSSEVGYSSDRDEEDIRKAFESAAGHNVHRRRTRTVAGGERMEDILSSQASQETATTKFHRILNNAIMEGLDSVDFSYIPLFILF